jgi:hypothetical protein
MTREAFLLSKLNVSNDGGDVLGRLGIDDWFASMETDYLDLGANRDPVTRSSAPSDDARVAKNFGDKKIELANQLSPYKPTIPTLPAWLMLGAIREDDVSFDARALENTPQDEPGGPFDRVLNHFFDPYHNISIGGGGASVCNIAPDWALTRSTSPTGTCRVNDFTVLAAREAMWRALTLKQIDAGTGTMTDVPISSAPLDPSEKRETTRKKYWATTFRALGNVVHLLQDMAQPQHTRNDPHAGAGCFGSDCTFGHKSYYENYIEARATGATAFTLRETFFTTKEPVDTRDIITQMPLNFGNYPIPRFAGFRDYFATATGDGSVTGRGLANYSNQGFYSVGTNLGSMKVSAFPSPTSVASNLTAGTIPDGYVRNEAGDTVRGALQLLLGSVTDQLDPGQSVDRVALSAHGMFDQFLKVQGKSQFVLTHYNYDDQAKYLIPRAVSYSTGLLDYFFRGRIEIAPPDAGFYGLVDHASFAPPNDPTDISYGYKGFDKIKAKVRNTTDTINPPGGSPVKQDMPNGVIVAVVKFRRNFCYDDLLAGWPMSWDSALPCRSEFEDIVVSDPAQDPSGNVVHAIPHADDNPSGIELTFNFSEKQVPINAWDVVLQVVYRGKLGGEDDAVAVATKDISEPMFTNSMNFTDYVVLNGNFYLPNQLAQDQFSQVLPGCRTGQMGSYTLSPACYDIDNHYTFTAGTSNVQIKIDSIPPRRLTRMVLLGDFEHPPNFNWQPGALRCWVGVPNPLPTHPYPAQDINGSFIYGVPSVARGVKGWWPQVCYSDVGAVPTPLASVPWDQLPDLQFPAEASPLPLTISNW